MLDLDDDTRSPYPKMIHRSSPPKMLAPVPKEWQPYTLDAAYTFVACLPSSSHRYVIAARHASGETCSVQKCSGVGLDVSRDPLDRPCALTELVVIQSKNLLERT